MVLGGGGVDKYLLYFMETLKIYTHNIYLKEH